MLILLSRLGSLDTFWHLRSVSSGQRLWSDTALFSRCRCECLVTQGAKSMQGACLHPCCYATKQFSVFLDNGFGILLQKSSLERSKWRQTRKIERKHNYATQVLSLIHIHKVTPTLHHIPTLQTEIQGTSQFNFNFQFYPRRSVY